MSTRDPALLFLVGSVGLAIAGLLGLAWWLVLAMWLGPAIFFAAGTIGMFYMRRRKAAEFVSYAYRAGQEDAHTTAILSLVQLDLVTVREFVTRYAGAPANARVYVTTDGHIHIAWDHQYQCDHAEEGTP